MGLRDGGRLGPGAVSRPTVGGGAYHTTLQYNVQKYKYNVQNTYANINTSTNAMYTICKYK